MALWSIGYFVSTVGVNERTVQAYIENQGREDSEQAESYRWEPVEVHYEKIFIRSHELNATIVSTKDLEPYKESHTSYAKLLPKSKP